MVSLAERFRIEARLVVEDLDELARWRQAQATRPIVPWLMSRYGWAADAAHYYLTALERVCADPACASSRCRSASEKSG